jgi:hypothetical protein
MRSGNYSTSVMVSVALGQLPSQRIMACEHVETRSSEMAAPVKKQQSAENM